MELISHKLIYLGKCHGRGISVLVVTKGSRVLVVAVHICSASQVQLVCMMLWYDAVVMLGSLLCHIFGVHKVDSGS